MSDASKLLLTEGAQGAYFDGTRATPRPVWLVPEGRQIKVLAGPDGALIDRVDLTRDTLFERFARAPRQIALASGASIELPQSAATERMLAAAGAAEPPVVRWQRRWPVVLMMLAALICGTVLAYLYALPAAVKWAAFQIPDSYLEQLDTQVLAAIERERLLPSQLPAARQSAIAARFRDAAARHAPEVRYRLLFRSSPGPAGINAFALPGGTIVLLDGLVDLVGDNVAGDDRVLAVLGHELGHVANRHSMRRLMQTTAVALGATVLWGDAAGLATNVPVLLSAMSYSRDMERDADDYAIAFLQSNGLTPTPLIGFFMELDRHNGQFARADFLSTHPKPRERVERIRAAQP